MTANSRSISPGSASTTGTPSVRKPARMPLIASVVARTSIFAPETRCVSDLDMAKSNPLR